MYLGFMKMGVSLMGLFFGTVAILQFLDLGIIGYFSVLIWFYSFFHVNNLISLSDTDFANMQDEYLFSIERFFEMDKKGIQKHRKLIAAVLMAAGVILLWNGFIDICYSYLPEYIVRFLSRIGYTIPKIGVGTGIIIGGFYMIKGKKDDLNEVIIDIEAEENMQTRAAEEIVERSANGSETDNKNA
ncbi:MAG: hypothetical protein GX235_10440 [Clostridiales bacterium]|nr:hypothetical protein [Clostridiales bacterium]